MNFPAEPAPWGFTIPLEYNVFLKQVSVNRWARFGNLKPGRGHRSTNGFKQLFFNFRFKIRIVDIQIKIRYSRLDQVGNFGCVIESIVTIFINFGCVSVISSISIFKIVNGLIPLRMNLIIK